MSELYTVTAVGQNIATERTIATFTYAEERALQVIIRLDAGTLVQPIAGGGMYTLNVYINDVIVLPSADIPVAVGRNRATLVSRPIPLEENDVLRVTLRGQAGDTAVTVKTTIRDQSPLVLSDVIGTGPVTVDHDFGGTDALAIHLETGGTVDNATIQVFRKADYDAGNRGQAYAVAVTQTDVNGRWTHPAVLDPGQYTLVVFKQGAIHALAHNITVT